MSRAIWLVLDSLGLGAAPDAQDYGDAGADTFGHIAEACAAAARGALRLPNLARLGLPQAHAAAHGRAASGFERLPPPEGLWGHAMERACGKDTPSGHWETAGVVLTRPFGLFADAEDSFPPEFLAALVAAAGLPGVLGNCHASGTEIIQRLGGEHLRSGAPIVYTSADSVFQVAAHGQSFGLERLYRLCELARELLAPYDIGRVIARPFEGSVASGFTRTSHRRDYALPPPAPTLFDATLAALSEAGPGSLIATNFVDFDMVYGHRRDVFGYAAALEAFDARLPELLGALREGDLLVLSADHGCDPTQSGSDHTRECVPALAFGPGITARALGRRDSFADLGQSMAAHLGLPPLAAGQSFL